MRIRLSPRSKRSRSAISLIGILGILAIAYLAYHQGARIPQDFSEVRFEDSTVAYEADLLSSDSQQFSNLPDLNDDLSGFFNEPLDTYAAREVYEETSVAEFLLARDEPVSTFSSDVDTASYSNMRRWIEDGRLPPAHAVRTDELVNYFDYGYAPAASAETPFEPTVWITPTPWNEDTRILHIGIRGFEVIEEELPLLNLVFLIDVSGSMSSDDKLPLVRRSLLMLLDELRPEDRVSIVTYAGNAGVVLKPTEARLREEIEAAIGRLQSGGTTAGAAGLRTAYELAEQDFDSERVNRVIMASDGDFNVGETRYENHEDFIAAKRETGIYFTYLGFGRTGNYDDYRGQVLAQAGNGLAAYIDSFSEARRVLGENLRATVFPIADDVKFQVEFNPARIAEYRLIGYETRMLDRRDFNDDTVDAGDIGSGHTVTALYEIVPVGSPAVLTDPLRYQAEEELVDQFEGELAFVRMRFKRPGEDESNLIERPVTEADAFDRLRDAPEDARFAVAVAAFGQRLRGDRNVQDYSYREIIRLANRSRGEDEGGYRAEFVSLVRDAQTIARQHSTLIPH